MKGLKEITGCQSAETHSVYVCDVHVFLQRSKTRVCMYECVCLHVSAQGSDKPFFPPACPHLITEEWTQKASAA